MDARRAHAREEAAIIGPASAGEPAHTQRVQHFKARRTESGSGERIRFSGRTCEAREGNHSGKSKSCSSPFTSTHPGTRNTGCESQRRTEGLIAAGVSFDGFVEPTCGTD